MLFAEMYPIKKEGRWAVLVVDPAISALNEHLTVPIVNLLIYN